ncbi:MAG TPA: DUF2298 domain-containing protein [Candidatus Methylacidiphilales bacterium]|jgi:hypothetical protein|nr:DUF2298 domain-containing protein [Candidatus Methylacidiphilales bacterium]
MTILKDLLLWGLVIVHVVGAAFLFRRVFPRESRWLAFLFPGIAFVLLCNFIEHEVALPNLRLFLPLTTAGSVLAMVWTGSPWRIMRLPSLIFACAFTFTLGLRFLWPAISTAQDGGGDLAIMSAFLFGQTLPVEGTWMASVKMQSYYCLGHYGAALLTRFLGVEIGTGFNLSEALCSAYIYFIAGGVAWHLSRARVWVTILCVVLTASAATGTAGYVWLLVKAPDPDNIISPHSLKGHDPSPDIFLVHHLSEIGPYGWHILMPPGYGAWMGYLHSTQSGVLITGLAVLALVEALRRRRTDVPWLVFATTPLLMLTCCTWGTPAIGFLAVAGAFAAWRLKTAPRHPGLVVALAAGGMTLFEPMLTYFLNSKYPISLDWVYDGHTELAEFFFQWWPLYLPMLVLVFFWRRLNPVTRIVWIMTPLAFAAVETWTAGLRADMTQKCWAIIFAAAWLVFLPEVLRRRAWVCRVLALALVVNSVLAFCFWTTFYYRTIFKDDNIRGDIGHLDGLGPYGWDVRKARILAVVSRLPGETILPGAPCWSPVESGLLPLFSHTRAYLSTDSMSDWVYYPDGLGEGSRRTAAVQALYDGKQADPLVFLRQHNIGAFVINPDDNIHPPEIAKLRAQLAPYYTYEEANDRDLDDARADVNLGDPSAGVFVYHPEVTKLLGEPKARGSELWGSPRPAGAGRVGGGDSGWGAR